jgi:hypothetical protein
MELFITTIVGISNPAHAKVFTEFHTVDLRNDRTESFKWKHVVDRNSFSHPWF